MATNASLSFRVSALAVAYAMVSSVAFAQGGITGTKQGQGGSVVQGNAGTRGSNAPEGLQRCDKPMGAVAVVEPQDQILGYLRHYNLQSPVGLIRMMIQQSNCFIVVERGVGMQNAMQERSLASSGELRSRLERGRRPDGDGRLHPDARRGLLREQRRRRRRRGRRPARSPAWAPLPAA